MPGEILQIDDVAAALPCRGEGSDPKRVNRHGWVEVQSSGIALDDELDGPARQRSYDESIVATHTLIPEALRHAFGTHTALMSPELPLTRRQHEMIATMVSATNRCHY